MNEGYSSLDQLLSSKDERALASARNTARGDGMSRPALYLLFPEEEAAFD